MKWFLMSILSISITAFSQVTIQGTVKSSDDQSTPLENAFVKLLELDISGIDTAKTVIDSTFTDQNGNFYFQVSTSVQNKGFDIPQKFELSGNYPNPFSDETKIDLYIQKPGNFKISIYNVLGQLVATKEQALGPGTYSIQWQGGELPGVYFAKVQSGSETHSIKLIQFKGGKSSTLNISNASTSKLFKQSNYYSGTAANYLQVLISKEDFNSYTSPILPFLSQSLDVVLFIMTEGTVRDIDGNTYRTVIIGNQLWMAENLKVTHYRNGAPILNVTDNTAWTNLTTGAFCSYNNDENHIATYGRLYNWYAVTDTRNIAPAGWHVPGDEEWKELEMYLGMSMSDADTTEWRGTDEGGKLKESGTTHWQSPNTGATNESGFSALPGGYRDHFNGNYGNLGSYAGFWSSTECNSSSAWCRVLSNDNSRVIRGNGVNQAGFSVRCVSD